ncbi:DNA type IV secretion system protein ComB10 [Helicobacter pylori]|uniref:DNA type IV secretion system protein ComB10 n=1 Tax=Helicobacter pylori TaxID=210 RepID=UPI001237E3B6|nr:DNA type IV secretion system protein ComB10 [Helicobacter pylori]KAA6500685.1 TrbI/VirB10 family protein [Helicobacter pylori]KAA6504218.1 TrbI/VirB10 family protein [Helicobacter pylori]KAA6518664.1 TrbI/VirB10 family protein [Helicobacter pylori]
MKQSLLKKIGLGVGGFVVLMALGLLANKGSNNNNKEEIFQVSESKFPLSDYFFEEVKEEPKEKAKETPEVTTQEPTTQTSPNPSVSANPNIKDYSHLNNNLNQQNNTITHLQQVLQSPSKIKPKPKHTKEQLEFLNTRLKPLEPTKPATKPETEYGVDSFTNLKYKDIGTNEHKLLRTITADRMIPAFLITPISSQIAGKVTAQVESNIFASMGRAVLIPKGSKVIGYYNNNNQIGQYRLNIAWTRIITPQGINIMLTNARGADVKGYNGLVGQYISRNFQRYGIPLLTNTLSNGLLIGITSALANRQNRNGDGNPFFGDYLLMQLTRNTGMGINQVINQMLRQYGAQNPIIIIREGSRVFISPNLDIFIPKPKDGEVLAEFFKEKKPPIKTKEEINNEEEI